MSDDPFGDLVGQRPTRFPPISVTEGNPTLPEGNDPFGSALAAAVNKPKPPQTTALQDAVEPFTSYPETYSKMNKEARDQMSHGVDQISGDGGAWDKVKGAGNVGLGALNYVTSPINAGIHSVVGRPIERVTGIPSEYTDFVASLLLPTPKKVPQAPAAKPLTKLEDITQAGQRIGVDVPRIAGAEGALAERGLAAVKEMPIVGDPIVDASKKALGQMDQAASRTAGALGNPNIITAGDAVKDGLKEWVTGGAAKNKGSVAIMDRLFDPIDAAAANSNVTVPVSKTLQEVTKMASERAAFKGTKLKDWGPAVNLVAPAIKNKQGLSYAEINALRKEVGARLSGNIVPEPGMSQPDLKRIYGALKEDAKEALRVAGGQPLVDRFDRATRIADKIIERRNKIASIIGVDASARPELIVGRIEGMMQGGTKGDWNALLAVRKSLGNEAWGDVGASIAGRLGRNSQGEFSGATFSRQYNSVPERSKNIVFGPMKKDLDDLAKVSGYEKNIQKFASKSQSANVTVGFGEAAAIWAAPYVAIPTLIGGRAFSHWMAQPVKVNQMAGWARAQARAASAPTAQNIKRLVVATDGLKALAKADQQTRGEE